ncbi:MAG: hypothetical protein AAF539_03460, partial [Planctomycetota bacterium]
MRSLRQRILHAKSFSVVLGCVLGVAMIAFGVVKHTAAQIPLATSPGGELATRVDPVANLEEQLVNRLRATRPSQRDYLRFLVEQVRQNRLSIRLVIAVERYALRRNPRYAFPFFERAMAFEARK